MAFCAISGEPPQDPVVSSKSGNVYERRLILKYITDNGTDPITGEKLDESDLITIKASELNLLLVICRHLAERPATILSIPCSFGILSDVG
jgi:pre-mRNA-processing factor 19